MYFTDTGLATVNSYKGANNADLSEKHCRVIFDTTVVRLWPRKGRSQNRRVQCPDGYSAKSGDISGWGKINGKGGGQIVAEPGECAELCDSEESCESYEIGYDHGAFKCNLNTSAEPSTTPYKSYEFCSKDAEVVEASSSESDSTGYFYIPAENCTEDIGSVDTSLGQRGALSACEMSADVTRSEGEELWTLTLPGSTMIERIDFLDAAHLKDAVLTIEDPELPEGKQVIYTSEPLNPNGAASFSVTDEMYDASSTEYSWLVFGGVIRIHTKGAGIEGAVVKVIQGDVSQLSLNPTTAQAALVHDLTTATHNLEQAEREAYRDIPVPVEIIESVDFLTAGTTWTGPNGEAMATYSLPPSSTIYPQRYGEPRKTREANAQYGMHIGGLDEHGRSFM